jgi:hypothetical protein
VHNVVSKETGAGSPGVVANGRDPTSSPPPKARVEQVWPTRQIPQTQQPIADRQSGKERQPQLHKESHGKSATPRTGQPNLFG